MNRCCRRRYVRLIARPLLLLFVFSISIFPPGGRLLIPAAHAQLNLQRIVVLDFVTASGIDPMLGRKAADALAVEFTATGKYEVMSRDQVLQEIKAQGLSSPLDLLSQLKLASHLEAAGVVAGKIHESKVTAKPPRARVEISVTQTDVVSGEPVNGSRTVGDTGPKLGSVDPAVLLDEAISKAAYGAVKSMQITKLPQGIVQILDNRGQITLNIGARDGVISGMRMSVTRDEWDAEKKKIIPRKIGDIKVVDVEPAHSTAVASTAGLGIQTADRVRAIFETPQAPIVAGQSSIVRSAKHGGVSGLGGAVGALVAPLVALALFLGGASGNPTTAAVSGVSAQAGSEGSTVVVNWSSAPGILDPKNVVGYILYRNTSPSFTESNIIDFTQQASSYVDSTDDFKAVITINIDSTTGHPTITYTKTPNPTRQGSTGAQTLTINADHPPLRAGTTYFYAARRVGIQQPQTLPGGGTTTGGTGGGGGFGGGGGGGFGGGGTFAIGRQETRQGQQQQQGFQIVTSELSTPSSGATPLAKAVLISPPSFPNPGSDAIDLNNLTFTFQTVDNADLFQVQVSDSSSFPISRRYESPIKQFAGAPGGTLVTFSPGPGDIAARLPGLTGGAQLFWRVGWRNSRDSLPPASIVSPNDSGFVFSSAFSFKTAQGPPPPPSKSMRSRERLQAQIKSLMDRLSPEQRRKLMQLLMRKQMDVRNRQSSSKPSN